MPDKLRKVAGIDEKSGIDARFDQMSFQRLGMSGGEWSPST